MTPVTEKPICETRSSTRASGKFTRAIRVRTPTTRLKLRGSGERAGAVVSSVGDAEPVAVDDLAAVDATASVDRPPAVDVTAAATGRLFSWTRKTRAAERKAGITAIHSAAWMLPPVHVR